MVASVYRELTSVYFGWHQFIREVGYEFAQIRI